MSSYCLYGINFNEALENLERYLKAIPQIKMLFMLIIIAMIHFEQISDEKKDLKPLLDAKQKIEFFLGSYPDSDYALDLKFKRFIQNQLVAKELYVARFYISVQKWFQH